MTVLVTAQDRVTVLVVDDSDDQRVLLTRYFERAGYPECDVALPKPFTGSAGVLHVLREHVSKRKKP